MGGERGRATEREASATSERPVRIRRGLLVVEVLNFEDLTEEGVFGGEGCEPPATLRISLVSPDLLRWQEVGPFVPQPLTTPCDALLDAEASGAAFRAVPGVACIGSPLLSFECSSSPPRPDDEAGEGDGAEQAPWSALVCTELVGTEDLKDPQVHLWEHELHLADVRQELELKQAEFEENPGDKALAAEIQQLEADSSLPVPPLPNVEHTVTLRLDEREAVRLSVSLTLSLDPPADSVDAGAEPDEVAEDDHAACARPPACPRPVEEAFDAAQSVLSLIISNAVDDWLDYVFQRQARQYAASYCLLAASSVIELAELEPVGLPEALAKSTVRRTAPVPQPLRPLSAQIPSGSPSRPPLHPRVRPQSAVVPAGGMTSLGLRDSGFGGERGFVDGGQSGWEGGVEEASLPFWGQMDDEPRPAPVDSMARGMLPIRMRRDAVDLTDPVLLAPQSADGRVPSGKGKGPKKDQLKVDRPAAPAPTAASKITPLSDGVVKPAAAAGRLRPASAPVSRASALAADKAGTRIKGSSRVKETSDSAVVEADDAPTTRPRQPDAGDAGGKAGRSAPARRPASAAPRAREAFAGGNVLESQQVVMLFHSRQTLLRSLFEHYRVPGVGTKCKGSVNVGTAHPVRGKAPSLDEVFGGKECLSVHLCLQITTDLGLVSNFVTEHEAAEAFAPGDARALNRAVNLAVNLLDFVRGLGRIALRGFGKSESSSKDFSAASDKVAALLRHIEARHRRLAHETEAVQQERSLFPLPSTRLSLSPAGIAHVVDEHNHRGTQRCSGELQNRPISAPVRG